MTHRTPATPGYKAIPGCFEYRKRPCGDLSVLLVRAGDATHLLEAIWLLGSREIQGVELMWEDFGGTPEQPSSGSFLILAKVTRLTHRTQKIQETTVSVNSIQHSIVRVGETFLRR